MNSEKFIEYISEKWKNSNCECCGENKWDVVKNVFQLVQFDSEETKGIERKSLPVIAVGCLNCGNLRFTSAIKSGIIKMPKDTDLDNDKNK